MNVYKRKRKSEIRLILEIFEVRNCLRKMKTIVDLELWILILSSWIRRRSVKVRGRWTLVVVRPMILITQANMEGPPNLFARTSKQTTRAW